MIPFMQIVISNYMVNIDLRGMKRKTFKCHFTNMSTLEFY